MKNLNVIIAEDESGAANNLEVMLQEINPNITVLAKLPSIEDSVNWLLNNGQPDLAFFDIQLEDGLSFEIFKEILVDFPVIFTTAYDQYAIEAFKVNSIDYLLKPIKEEDLQFSLSKFEKLKHSPIEKTLAEFFLNSIINKQTKTFLVHYKDRLIPISASDIAYFHIKAGLVHGCTLKNQTYIFENTLEELEEELDKTNFFRANRQYIINKKAIKDIEFYFNGRLSINMITSPKELILISKARVPIFKQWIKSNPNN